MNTPRSRGRTYRPGRQAPDTRGDEGTGQRPAQDTFPKFLALNATRFADRPAMRHKDLGIWRTWTWREVADEVRAFALGLGELGLQRGDRVAIVGRNRPKLYWSMAAIQAWGGIPVPGSSPRT